MASVALANGLNANLLRKWVAESPKGGPPPKLEAPPPTAEFVALPLIESAKNLDGADIQFELRRGATTVTIRWPARAASECAAWLRPPCQYDVRHRPSRI
jgi:transposase-like protein